MGTIGDSFNPSRAYFQGSRTLTTEQTYMAQSGTIPTPVVLTFKGARPLQPSKRIWHNQGQFQPQSCLLSREPDPYNRANVYGTIRDNSNPSCAYFQGSRALTTEQTHTT